jgi:prephenate dehydratase
VVQPLSGGPRVAYSGEPGAFAEDAVLRFFAAPEAIALSSFRAVFEAVRDGEAEAGVVPVESSLLGSIRENLDLLWAFELPIVGEVSVPVRLALLALPGETLESVERVYSIAAALAQADEFLRSRPWSIQTTYNTAGAAKQVADRGERGAAAVAAARVADIYGLQILADDIQGGDDNRTRFAVIARAGEEGAIRAAARPGATGGPPRTTLVFAVRNVPGSLHRSLGAFASRGLNLSRLESRPWTARGARWEYLFWVDLDADPADPQCAAALRELATETEVVRILGTYARAAED